MPLAKTVSSLLDPNYDGVILINDTISNLEGLEKPLLEYKKINANAHKEVILLPVPNHPDKRLIFSPVVSLAREYDDARRIYEAAIAGVKRAISSGMKKVVLSLGECKSAPTGVKDFERDNMNVTMILGAFYASYIPLETREFKHVESKLDALGFYGVSAANLNAAIAIEEGRRVARDIGGSDPERMAAPRVEEYVRGVFKDVHGVTLHVEKVNEKEFPLAAAVNRACVGVDRHDGRIITLEYTGETDDSSDVPPTVSLIFIGKGITYDTGGVDVKISGGMRGMHRDKCGAAAVVGLFKTLSILKPKNLNVKAYCAFVRNSIGEEAYVTDEIIVSRAGKRIRIGNTDAEGRMVMADLLCKAKEEALSYENPHLFTVATLTGHVIRAYGPNYTAVMSNGPARQLMVDELLQERGTSLAEPVEISRIRREDMEFHALNDDYADVLQCNEKPSSETPRGHMTPAGFLMLASGLDQHGSDSKSPLPYTHIDVAGSSGLFPLCLIPTGAPLGAITAAFVLPRC